MLCLWCLYLGSIPFYQWKNGMPQPSAFIFIIVLILIAIAGVIKVASDTVVATKFLFLFVAYTLLINLIWGIVLQSYEGLTYSLYYSFNFFVFLATLHMYAMKKNRFLLITVHTVSASILVLFILSFLYSSQTPSGKETLFFNNPNQLGYYLVLCATLSLIGAEYLKVNKFYIFIVLIAATWLIALSHSKAAMISMLMLFFIMFRKKLYVFTFFIILLLFFVLINSFLSDWDWIIDSSYDWVQIISLEPNDGLSERGYDKIILYPQYLLFGAGEGVFERFYKSKIGEHEMHSTFANIFFSYGGIGFFLFAIVLFTIWKKTDSKIFLIPAFFYGVAHNGLRGSLFWILIAIVLCLSGFSKNENSLKGDCWYINDNFCLDRRRIAL